MMSKNINLINHSYQRLNCDNELTIRQKKLLKLRQKKVAYPNDFRRNYISNQLHKQYKYKTNEELIILNIKVNIAGRIISKRIMGKASFITLRDIGGYIQLYITTNSLISKKVYETNVKQWDIGDILGVQGILFKTRTGELSVRCQKIRLLTKSLRSIPSKFHGLNNSEIKYRQRYLDLISNEDSLNTFKIRSLIISEIRDFMKQHDFIEVETPMMHITPGGAIARPFITYHNKFAMNMYLRIAPELYLKKLIVGGFERIFEINRSFRNESVSPYHNPEFTMMEIYIAYADYHDMTVFIQDLFKVLIKKILGNNIVKYGDLNLDFSNPFIEMSIKEAITFYLPETKLKNMNDIFTVINILKSFGIQVDDTWTLEKLHMILFEEMVSTKIVQPTYITGYPTELSPLARCNDHDSKIADRFELFIAGQEIGNGFSELNDPDDQRNRFFKQIQTKKDNTLNQNSVMVDVCCYDYDEDYLVALEYGLPPTAGVGIGIDRLVMLLTNKHNIRDVILFPTLRPK